MAQRPVIGVIGCNKMLEGEPAQTVKGRYVDAVSRYADAIPLIIPSLDRPEDAPAIIDRVDALLLTGAISNIEPHHFGDGDGREPKDPFRDTTALALIAAAREADAPIIGICRGLQEINVALGGTLSDQRDDDTGSVTHHAPDDASWEDMFAQTHEIDVAPGSLLSQIVGASHLDVNSVHYQYVATLGDGLRVEATAHDGVVEAISSRDGHAIFAVQWHPEWRPDTRPHDLAFWRHVGNLARLRLT